MAVWEGHLFFPIGRLPHWPNVLVSFQPMCPSRLGQFAVGHVVLGTVARSFADFWESGLCSVGPSLPLPYGRNPSDVRWSRTSIVRMSEVCRIDIPFRISRMAALEQKGT
jgi:hypothetical protein